MRFQRRLRILYLCFCVALGVVWLRAGQLQVLDGEAWAQAAREMRQSRQPLEARRGSIISADGKVLAEDTHTFQLAIVPWEWERRGRARCADCGAMYYERGNKTIYIPRTCACARHARRGGSGELRRDAYPRGDVSPETGGQLEKLPDGDIRALEKALEYEPGTIARLAKERLAEIKRIIGRIEKQARDKGDTSVFLETFLNQQREDLLKRRFIISGRIPDEVARLVLLDENGRYRGLRVVGAMRRFYPAGDFAPWLLGWTSKMRNMAEVETLRDQFGKPRITLETRWGRRGLERAYNAQLHGVPGIQVRELDKQGRFTKVIADVAPRPGHTLHLSIDVDVSRQGERILEDQAKPNDRGHYFPGGRPSAAFLMIDAHTGEILVWSETPRFDLNEELSSLYSPDGEKPVIDPTMPRAWRPRAPFEAPIDYERWQESLVVPVPLTLSRVGQVPVEPGSTMKPFIGLAMLSSGKPLPFRNFECAGGRNPGCHHCGLVGLERAICRSCNRYFAFSLRDSKYWPTYRRSIGAFVDSLGIGHRPTSECADWSKGRWLWDWCDFELRAAVARAQARLDAKYAPKVDADGALIPGAQPTRAAPRLEVSFSPRAPATVGGDIERLSEKFAALADWVAQKSGRTTVQIHVSQEGIEGTRVNLRFEVRGAGRAGWFALPGIGVPAEMPKVVHAMAADRRGVQGDLGRGGAAWFRIQFPRHMGRTDPKSPPVIRPDDGRNVAIGQGPVLTTPLHMARAAAVLANGGVLVEPHAVRAVGTRRTHFERRRLPVSQAHIDRIRSGMWDVVNIPEGTADTAGWHVVPAEVYGKTGTAQVGKTWQPWEAEEEEGPWHHWFVGFAEAPGKRTVAFACVLHSRTEAAAGMTAAPATAKILAAWYASARSKEPRAMAGGR